MEVLRESWCFCNGGGKSERMKAAIFSGKGCAMAGIISSGGMFSGTGFLIHRNLLLTTHVILPSVAAAEAVEIRLQNGVTASLFPHRFFITSSVLDLTIVGLDCVDGDTNAQMQQVHYMKTCSKPNLDLGGIVYLLGFTDQKDLAIGEGKVVIATDNLIKLSTDGVCWSPGSAGFDVHGNLAFMVCDPMKLATSPNTKSSSTSSSSSSSWKKDLPLQFGIPIPIICDWLNQHWEGSLDELNKPKLPIIRLMSQKSDHSCASFTMRRVFKPTETELDATTLSPNVRSRPSDQTGPSFSVLANACKDNIQNVDPHVVTHPQGIPTPEIYESPKVTSFPIRKKESNKVQLLDINFPPKIAKAAASLQPAFRNMLTDTQENCMGEANLQQPLEVQLNYGGQSAPMADADISSTGSVSGAGSEVESSASAVEVQELCDEYSSEGETTMYSAETAESRNIPSPRGGRIQQVGRSQSCVNYNRWGPVQRYTVASGAMMEKHRNFMQSRRVYSQGAASQRSNDYFSPTVSSIMKKRGNNTEQPNRQQPSAVHSSPRWMF